MNEDKATRYQRLRRRASVASFLWSVSWLTVLVWTGSSVALREAAEWAASPLGSSIWSAGMKAAAYVVLLSLLGQVGELPIDYYGGFLLEHRYSLSTERVTSWLLDQLKGFVLSVVLACSGVVVLHSLMTWSPRWWWLTAGLTFAALLAVLTKVAPVLLLPIFYRVKPIERESLRRRLLALADRCGARVLGAYEWGLGDKTRKANAALAGLGGTRRILVSDTMLADYSDEEIEVVLAHEIAHHVHGDIWKGVAFEGALILAGFRLASWLLDALALPLGLRGVTDLAGLPLVVLAVGSVSLLTLPLARAISRANERSADRFALALTRNPEAFISAMRRLKAQNLAEEDPSKIVQWLFYTHPPIGERIAAAQAFSSGR